MRGTDILRRYFVLGPAVFFVAACFSGAAFRGAGAFLSEGRFFAPAAFFLGTASSFGAALALPDCFFFATGVPPKLGTAWKTSLRNPIYSGEAPMRNVLRSRATTCRMTDGATHDVLCLAFG